jgi:prepilin-type N-terminal cleavage/methylation domain-containing protein
MRRAGAGFTLIELILVVVLVSILAVVAMPMLMAGFNAFSQQRETAAIEREAMLALERISREVRIGRQFLAGGGNISFERDDNPVTISRTGDELVLDVNGTPSVLARNVTSASFDTEIHEGACYVLVAFETTGVSETWRSVTYARNSTCDD